MSTESVERGWVGVRREVRERGSSKSAYKPYKIYYKPCNKFILFVHDKKKKNYENQAFYNNVISFTLGTKPNRH